MNAIKNLIKTLKGKKRNKWLYRSGTDLGSSVGLITDVTYSSEGVSRSGSSTLKEDKRLDRKPAEIFKEIISDIPKMDLRNLDKKIKMVKRRRDVLKNEIGMACIHEEQALLYPAPQPRTEEK